uniref:Bifunctional coenzyme A synthase n=1 Tax=Callorhinchus milii TaxID=7868 RepID=V9KJY8_CALMI
MAVFRTGILVLTSPLPLVALRVAPVLASAAQIVKEVLYVHFHPGLRLSDSCPLPKPLNIPASYEVSQLITNLYTIGSDVWDHLDIRILLSNIKSSSSIQQSISSVQNLSQPPEVVLTDYKMSDINQSHQIQKRLAEYACGCFTCRPNLTAMFLPPKADCTGKQEIADTMLSKQMPGYSDVVVGGTFDKLHAAHRILLSASCLLAEQRLLIGVADGELLNNKVLKELIDPYQWRIERLREFLLDVKPLLQYDLVSLENPYGPSVNDAKLDCIVVSEETRSGGEAVNRKRLENGLQELIIHEIRLVKDTQHTVNEEEKISSSTLRKRLLGSLLVPPKSNPRIASTPYLIGLTGSTGSGKSSVLKILHKLGAHCIDADKLGHETYQPGTLSYHRIIQEFGQDIVQTDGTINRSVLGKKVFRDEEKLKRLSAIVWPEIAKLMEQKIAEAVAEGATVCVVDAAVLMEAGWADMFHEIWVTFVPEEEALQRIMRRDNLSEEDAKQRLESQWTNTQRIHHANVVLCTLWEPEVTEKQVRKAWQLLAKRRPT